jgi:hypothetical protein
LVLMSMPYTAKVLSGTQTGPYLLGPTVTGALTITAASNGTLTVETESGLSCSFSLDSLTYSGPSGC